jgi:hypothetical protein
MDSANIDPSTEMEELERARNRDKWYIRILVSLLFGTNIGAVIALILVYTKVCGA